MYSILPPRYIWPSHVKCFAYINFLGIFLEFLEFLEAKFLEGLVEEPSSGKQIYPPLEEGSTLLERSILS